MADTGVQIDMKKGELVPLGTVSILFRGKLVGFLKILLP